jgi:capsular exopolysaccharide synthesis family protein
VNSRDYLKVIRRKWPVMVACSLAAGLVMWLITPANPPEVIRVTDYTATSILLVNSAPGQDGVSPGVSLDRVALFVTTGDVPRRVAERVGFTEDPALLATRIDVVPNPASMSMSVSMTGSDSAYVTSVANAFAEEAVAFFEGDPAGLEQVSLAVQQQATPIPVVASGGFTLPPSRALRTSFAALLGLLIGFGLALVLHQLDSRLRTRDEVYEALRMPVVAEIPKLGRGHREHARILVADEPHGIYADGYRTARAAIMHTASLGFGRGPQTEELTSTVGARVVLITSAQAAEGKTTSIANLAASFAETGQSVLVLDADLRSPDLHLLFDVPQGAGISDFLYDPSSTRLSALARPTSVPGVKIITAGTQLAHPASLATRMGVLIEEARKIADVILVDTAPLLAASDVFDLLPIVDTVAFVVRSGRLTENSAQRVSELLGRFHVPVVGAILVATPSSKGNGYGYGYGPASDDGSAKRRARRKSKAAPREDAPSRRRTRSAAGAPAEPVRADSDVTVGSRAFSPEVAEPVVDDFDPYNGYDPSRDAATTGPEQITETRRQRRASSR